MESERGRPGEGKERGRDARRERGAGPHAKKAALSHSLRAAEARAGPGQGKGSGGLSPVSPGRPWRPRPLHRPAGAATARAAGPRSLQQPRPPRAEPETLLLLFFFSCYCSCCPRPAAAVAHSRRSPGPPPSRVRVAPGGQDRAQPPRPPGDASALNGDGGSPNRHTVRGGKEGPPRQPRPARARAAHRPLPPPLTVGGRSRRARGTMGVVVSSGRVVPRCRPWIPPEWEEGREGGDQRGSRRLHRVRGFPCAVGMLVLRGRPFLHPPGESKGTGSACTAPFFKSCVIPAYRNI